MNVKCYQGYRKYNKEIPKYLVNRPRLLVTHCLDRMVTAYDIEQYHNKCHDQGHGTFTVKSQSEEGKWYKVRFGDSTTLCYCDCLDWQKWWLPCKHFIAIFNHYPAWQWDQLSPLYRKSPFLNLDEELMSKLIQPSTSCQPPVEDAPGCNPPAPESTTLIHQPLPPRHKTYRNEAAQCRGVMDQLRSATFLIHDAQVLQQLKDTLSSALNNVRKHIKTEDGIQLETSATAAARCTSVEFFPKLPKRKQKSKYSGRHGAKANQNKLLVNVKVGADQLLKNLHIQKHQQDDVESQHEIKDEVEAVNDVAADMAVEDDDEEVDVEMPEPPYNDDIQIVKVCKQLNTKVDTRDKRKMDNVEKDTIREGNMLTDVSINVAQIMLKQQFPFCEGLQETTLGSHLQFSVCGGEFVQILFTNTVHWVTVSNISCRRGEVNLFDSYSSCGIVPDHVMKQVATILHEEGPDMTINIKPVQQQTNGLDCGVFAIAFATSLLNGEDPTNVTYDVQQLRPHLLSCLDQGHLVPFPKDEPVTPVTRCPSEQVTVGLFCSCRRTWSNNDKRRKATRMACCDTCGEWYHQSCENIPDIVFKKHSFWQCYTCACH